MKARKRVLSLLLALLMLVSLFPTAALAEEPEEETPEEEAPAFLTQPESGSVPEGESWLVTWQLNRIPDRLELVREEDQPGETLLVPVQELEPTDTGLELTAPEEETVFRLRAFYGEEELVSEAFTVTLIPAEEPVPAEEPAEEPATAEEPAEEPAPAEAEDAPEAEPAAEPEAAPADNEEPEELRRLQTLSSQVVTLKANGTLDGVNVGGAIQLSATSVNSGSVVTCQVQTAVDYRLVAVYFGPTSAPLSYDVTGSNPKAIMPTSDAQFTAVFIPDGATMLCRNVAVRLSAPSLGNGYSGTVSADVTKYFNKDGAAYSALDAYSVSAVWKEEGGSDPTNFHVGGSYYALITLMPNSGWSFASGFDAVVTMPDGSVVSAGTMEKLPLGGYRFSTPLYTIPEPEEGYHALYGRSSTYDANGAFSEDLVGGTVRVNTSFAQEGETVSCTVTPNAGYHVAYVLFGGFEPILDVTDTLQATMLDRDCAFSVTFVADGANRFFSSAAVEIASPALNQNYGRPVPASVTGYVTMAHSLAVPSTFHVENAHWQLSGDFNPSVLLPGDRACAVFDLVPNEGFEIYDMDDFCVEITMPDGSVYDSVNNDFRIYPQEDGSVHVRSPYYSFPGSSSGPYHVLGKASTYNANGEYDESLVGGTVTVSTNLAQEGETVSCTVTPNAGYHLAYVLYGPTHGEPRADVTDTLQATMLNGDSYFNAVFVADGGSIGCPAAAVRLDYPEPAGYTSLPAATVNKYFSVPLALAAPGSFEVQNAAWRDTNGQCVGMFYSGSQYYATFTLTPNEGWYFEDPFIVELTMPDGSVLHSYNSDFTITRNADGTVTVKTPTTTVPATVERNVSFEVEVYGADYQLIRDVIGGTASFSCPASVRPGDTVTVTAEPAPGYQLQYVYYDNGVIIGYDATQTMSFTVPEDYNYGLSLAVCFTPVGTTLPLPGMSQIVELPVAGARYSGGGRVMNAEGQWYDVESVTWYGGAGSGCQGQEPARFLPGASYYAEVVLTPHEHWYWKSDTQPLMLYHDPTDPDPNSVNWDLPSGGTYSLDSQGRLHIVGREIALPAGTLGSVELGIQMFEEGGDYPQGCPVAFELPDDAFFTVSDAVWYNYANQESGGIGLAAGFFTADGRYFTEFDLIPNEGYVFTADTQIELTNGSVEIKTLNSDGSLHVVTSWFSLDPETAAQYRRVFVTNYLVNPDGSTNPSGVGGYVLPNDGSPKVGDTLIFGVMPKNGYRLQWLTVARHSEWIGDDITDTLEFYVDDEPNDVYVNAMFALADEPVTCRQVNLNVELPLPGGNYSGYAPATVTPFAANASEYTVQSARWYEQQTGGVGTPSSFVPGQEYCVEIVVAPDPKWSFADNVEAMLYLSDGSYMSSWSGDVGVYKLDNGNLCLTSGFLTLPEAAIDSVELSLDLPEEGDSFEFMSQPWATFYTPHVGEMYTIWKNGADQATGAKGEQTSSFQPGCVYYATIRTHADQGYYLTPDTRVTLRNDLSFTTQYSTMDRSIWIDTESITIPGPETYTLSGDYVRFLVEGTEVTEARPGTVVEVRSDIYTIPGGKYLAQVFCGDTELEQTGLDNWSFVMPAENVTLTGVIEDAETYVFELEDGIHEIDAFHAAWIFGTYSGGVILKQDVNGDGVDDIRVTFRDDGSAQVIRLGEVFGTIDSGLLPGRVCRQIFRFGPERYDLYLGNVQVDAENKSNIPVLGGRASYDPDTKTLTLTDYTGSIGVAEQGELYPSLTSLFSITSGGDLTVTGSGRLTDKTLYGGISCGGNLTLSGDFEIHAGYYGIYTNGNLTVYGNTAIYDTTQMGVDAIGDLRVLLGSLRVMTDEGIGVYSSGDVTVAGDLHSEAGEAGLQCSGNVTLMGGTIWADSLNDIGLLGGSDLYVQNGGFTAHGNIQALEVASISFDTATHFISLPVNGTVSDDDTTIIDPSTGDPARNAQITDKKPTVNLGVKDLDGSEGVGGTVAINSGSYSTTASGSFSYGATITIRAQAAEGYLFDHWEDAYGGSFSDESQNSVIQVGVYVDCAYFAVFEELLPINETNFPDENFRSYVAENCDPNGDGYLSWAERNAVTSIDVSSKSITSLVGLKHFPELTRLYCYSNPDLREVDVRQNKKILYVQCYSCSKLERLYITGCSELRDLRCYSCNLTFINFSGCTELKMLQCYSNRLSYLNLGGCHKLGRVDCQNNANLSELNINSEDLYILFCYGTKLDTLDVSSCSRLFDTYIQGEFSQTSNYDRYSWMDGSTIKGDIRCNKSAEIEGDLGIPVNQPNFPDPVFREYISNGVDLNHNGWLSPLEIEKCTGIGPEELDIRSVKGIEFLTEMDNLLIDGAPNLKSIDLRANTKLGVIDICDNGLEEILLDGLTGLYALYVENNALTEFDVSAFTLETFFCHGNPLTSLELGDQPELKNLYAHRTNLAELDLSGCPILLDAYLNGTVTEYDGYVKYAGGPLGGTLYIDADQVVITEATPDHIPGDINGDGKVNNKDLTRLQRYLKGANVVVNPAALDVNGDGKVNNKDLTRLQRYLKGANVEIY